MKISEDPRERAVVQHRLAMSKRQLVNIAHRDTVAEIEVAVAIPHGRVPPVWSVSGVAFQLLRDVVQTVRIGVSGLEAQSILETSFQACLQAIVIAVTNRIRIFYLAKVGIRNDRDRLPRAVFGGLDSIALNERLVVVADNVQMRGFGADIVHFRGPGIAYRALDAEAPLLHIRGWVIGVHGADMKCREIVQINR